MSGRHELGLVYELTPEVVYSPVSKQNQHLVYKIGSILPLKEGRNIEYKAGGGSYPFTILPSHVQKYGSAFLNSNGGTLCVGIDDDGHVSGLYLSSQGRRKVSNIIKDEFNNFTPPVGNDLYQYDFVSCNRPDYFVIEIHVKPGHPSEIYADRENKMWIRRDGSVQGPLWPREIREIVIAKYMKELTKTSTSGSGVTAVSGICPLATLATATPVISHQKK